MRGDATRIGGRLGRERFRFVDGSRHRHGDSRAVDMSVLVSALVLLGAVLVTILAAYEWTGLPRHWYMRTWNTALAAMLWLMWLHGISVTWT
jgi:hypothetical protein